MGNRIKELREAHQFSQADLAGLVRVPPGTIGRWERGDGLPTPKNRKRLAKRLGVSVEDVWPVEQGG